MGQKMQPQRGPKTYLGIQNIAAKPPRKPLSTPDTLRRYRLGCQRKAKGTCQNVSTREPQLLPVNEAESYKQPNSDGLEERSLKQCQGGEVNQRGDVGIVTPGV